MAVVSAQSGPGTPPAKAAVTPADAAGQRAIINQYCVTCHNARLKTANLLLDQVDLATLGEHPDVGEKIVRKLRAGMMPPTGVRRPDPATMESLIRGMETTLDHAATLHLPAPGLHRLNRTEYTNAIRDLLALEVDATKFLPADDSTRGFDNIAGALTMSPALMEAYLSAAGKISRLAIGVRYVFENQPARFGHHRTVHCRGNVWHVPTPTVQNNGERFQHPATFPVALAELAIKLSGACGDAAACSNGELCVSRQNCGALTCTPVPDGGTCPAGSSRSFSASVGGRSVNHGRPGGNRIAGSHPVLAAPPATAAPAASTARLRGSRPDDIPRSLDRARPVATSARDGSYALGLSGRDGHDAAVFALGHLGIGKKIAGLPYRRFSTVEKRAFFLGTLLPDLIDKPLFYIPFWLSHRRGAAAGILSGTHLFAHTALFLMVLAVTARLARSPATRALAIGVSTHFALDIVGCSMGMGTLLWPLFGWRFPAYPFRNLGQHLSTILNPITLAGELLGAAILLWDWRQGRRRNLE